MFCFLKYLVLSNFFICFIFGSAAMAANTSYYVDSKNGNDSNTGLSHKLAWKTLKKINSYNFESGDNVYLLCGSTWENERIFINWSGTSTDQVVVGAYSVIGGIETPGICSDGKPTINGNNLYPSDYNSGIVETAAGKSYVTIQDLEVINSHGSGIKSERGCSYITVKRCRVDNTYNPNILFYGSSFCIAENNEVSRGGRERIEGDTPNNWPTGGIKTRASTNSIVKSNYSYNHWGEGIDLGSGDICMYNTVVDTMSQGIYANGKSDIEIAYNSVSSTSDTKWENPNTPGWHGAGIAIAVEPFEVYSNCTNVKIHDNTVVNTYAGIRIYDSNSSYDVNGISIYSNKLINNRNSFHIGKDLHNKDVVVKNNTSFPGQEDYSHLLLVGEDLIGWDCDYNVWAIKPSPGKGMDGSNDSYETPASLASFVIADGSASAPEKPQAPQLLRIVPSE